MCECMYDFTFPFSLIYFAICLPVCHWSAPCYYECADDQFGFMCLVLFWHINHGIKMRDELFAYAQIQPLVYHWYEIPKFVKLDDLKMNETKITTNMK